MCHCSYTAVTDYLTFHCIYTAFTASRGSNLTIARAAAAALQSLTLSHSTVSTLHSLPHVAVILLSHVPLQLHCLTASHGSALTLSRATAATLHHCLTLQCTYSLTCHCSYTAYCSHCLTWQCTYSGTCHCSCTASLCNHCLTWHCSHSLKVHCSYTLYHSDLHIIFLSIYIQNANRVFGGQLATFFKKKKSERKSFRICFFRDFEHIIFFSKMSMPGIEPRTSSAKMEPLYQLEYSKDSP